MSDALLPIFRAKFISSYQSKKEKAIIYLNFLENIFILAKIIQSFFTLAGSGLKVLNFWNSKYKHKINIFNSRINHIISNE
jgi:hypothetical protein